jgi:hypothetical protein
MSILPSNPKLTSVEQGLIAEAFQTARKLHQTPQDSSKYQRLQARLYELQAQLTTCTHPICRESLAVEQIPLKVRQSLVEAVVLLPYYFQLGGATWQGTLTSFTLNNYLTANISVVQPKLEQLSYHFQLPEANKTQITQLLETVEAKISQQQKIIHAALASVGLIPDITQAPIDAASQLFTNLFGELVVPNAALEILFTDTQIYFCLDYEGEQLRDPDLWGQLSPTQQQVLSTFLHRHSHFTFEQFQQFPTFCLCNPAEMDANWVNKLESTTGFSTFQICQSLSQAVGLIPTHQTEKFLLHDIWGHHWQSVLTQFRGDYRILAKCDEPLRPGETAYTAHGPLTCREIFQLRDEQVSIDVETAQLFFQGEIRQRLGLMFTHLLGEMIADIAEFKFIWDHPEFSAELPSSSVFKNHPTKLDFAFSDLDFLFSRVLQPLLELHLSLSEASVLEQELLAEWEVLFGQEPSLVLQTSLKQAIAHLYQIFFAEYLLTCLPSLTHPSSLFADTLANLIHLQNVLNHLCTSDDIQSEDGLSLQILLVLFLGCYCSGDSYDEFWDVDKAIADFFLPAFSQLQGLTT